MHVLRRRRLLEVVALLAASVTATCACNAVLGIGAPIEVTSTGGAPATGATSASSMASGQGGASGGGPATGGAGAGTGTAGGGSCHAGAQPLRVFVTSELFAGGFGAAFDGGPEPGIAAADQFCQKAAQNAGLGGYWVAWLSDEVANAKDRFPVNGPWYLLDSSDTGKADPCADIGTADIWKVPQFLLRPIDRDEHGQSVEGRPVWTGTRDNGLLASYTCSSWKQGGPPGQGYTGSTNETGPHWTKYELSGCGSNASFYCFEQPPPA